MAKMVRLKVTKATRRIEVVEKRAKEVEKRAFEAEAKASLVWASGFD